MHYEQKLVAIYIPETLIPGIRNFKGDILLSINRMAVEGGFRLTAGQFVTSVSEYERMRVRVGLKDQKDSYNMQTELNPPTE